MQIHQRETGNHGVFFVQGDDGVLAEMTYHISQTHPDKMVIEHTEVNDQLKGKGVGLQLVHHAVDYARAHHLKILPLCPFAGAIIQKKPEFQDVLWKEEA